MLIVSKSNRHYLDSSFQPIQVDFDMIISEIEIYLWFSAPPVGNCHIDLARTSLTCASDVYMHGMNPDCSCDSGYNLVVENADITCQDTLFIPSHPQCEGQN